ncbi:MAG TPA: SRPBCC family protein [Gemmatales bacterium]|nr:SRPBCC family protein [Gemmatales bacterium]HMP61198.1 SRPBCC family protein [Gemmatales bacterium]
MGPIVFVCRRLLPTPATDVANGVLDLERWSDFAGYGPVPGIRAATFEKRTEAVVGTRIRVVNRDGSTHLEEIVEWEPERRLRLWLSDFSRPMSWLAHGFEERWDFQADPAGTQVTRTFALHPRGLVSRPWLWLISRLLRRAIQRHLEQMAQAGSIPHG